MNRAFRALLAVLSTAIVAVVLTAAPAGASGADEWRDLTGQRGVVVLMRHALAPGGGDPAGFRLGDCATQRNLSGQGRDQARRIGRQIRASGIDVAGVLSSPWCRSQHTARLLQVGPGVEPVQTRNFLGSTFMAPRSVADRREARTRQLIADHRGKGGVLILVGHYANIVDLTGVTTNSGGSVAVRMNRGGELDVVGRIPAP